LEEEITKKDEQKGKNELEAEVMRRGCAPTCLRCAKQ